MKRCFFFIVSLFFIPSVWALDGFVMNFSDDNGRGTLRGVIEGLCIYEGDDVIHFPQTTYPRIEIPLNRPLVIPEDCHGTLEIIGSTEKETILNGSALTGDEGILTIQSWGNTIRGLTFVGNEQGPGLSLENDDNVVEDNYFGIYRDTTEALPNETGIRVAGDWNSVRGNSITGNLEEGILIEGNANAIEGNYIGYREGSCSPISLPESSVNGYALFVREISYDPFFWMRMLQAEPRVPLFGNEMPNPYCGNWGPGIRITGERNLIGGDQITEGNRIVYNRGGGIVVEASGNRNRFSRNEIAYNTGPGIYLEQGANEGVESLVHLKSFPVESEPVPFEPFRYTLFGQGVTGTRVELYLVAANEEDDSEGHGEGAKFLEWFTASGEIFTRTLEREDVPPGSKITAMVCDEEGNCSGFSQNATLGRDSDHDGLLDPTEDPDGDLFVDMGESDPFLIDTDKDGLPDTVEDVNQNGKVDTGETSASLSDTDDDGISDFIETGGDGRYDPAEGDTNPNNRDTDGDRITDGDEDLNHDGVIQIGETDPRMS